MPKYTKIIKNKNKKIKFIIFLNFRISKTNVRMSKKNCQNVQRTYNSKRHKINKMQKSKKRPKKTPQNVWCLMFDVWCMMLNSDSSDSSDSSAERWADTQTPDTRTPRRYSHHDNGAWGFMINLGFWITLGNTSRL